MYLLRKSEDGNLIYHRSGRVLAGDCAAQKVKRENKRGEGHVEYQKII